MTPPQSLRASCSTLLCRLTFAASFCALGALACAADVKVEFRGEQGTYPAIQVPKPAYDWPAKNAAWMERVLITPFAAKVKGEAWGPAAVTFLRHTVAAWNPNMEEMWITHPELLREAEALEAQGVKDPLIVYFANYWRWLNSKRYRAWVIGPHGRSGFVDDGDESVRLMQVQFDTLEKTDLPRAILRLLAQDLVLAGSRCDWRVATEELEEKVMTWIEIAVKEGSYLPGDMEILAGHTFRWDVQPKRIPATYLPILDRTELPEWLRAALKGTAAINSGWESRGGGYANTVTAEGWKGYKSALAAGESWLKKSWEADPTHADAAARMLAISKSGEGDEDPTVWLDRAMKVDPTHPLIYSASFWLDRPQWGGSLAQILAVGKAGAETKRYETDIPERFSRAVIVAVDYEGHLDRRSVPRTPWIGQTWIEVTRGQMEEPSRAGQREFWQQVLLTRAYLADNFQLAHDTLRNTPNRELNLTSTTELWRCMIDPDFMYAEIDLFGTPSWDDYAKARTKLASRKPDFAGAQPHLAAAVAKAPENSPGRTFLQAQLAAAKMQADLPKGEWTPVPLEPSLWHVRAGKSRVENGAIIMEASKKQRGCLAFDLPVGRNYEIRGKFSRATEDGSTPVFGIAMRMWLNWMDSHLDFLAEPNADKTKFNTRLRREFSEYKFGNKPPVNGSIAVRDENEFLIRVTPKSVAFALNGEVAVPIYETTDYTDEGYERLAFITPKVVKESSIKITNLEIRSVAGKE